MSSKQLPDRPSAHDADVRMTEDPELESARKRVRDMQAASESEGVIAKGKSLWTEFRAEADERNKSMLEDIERGKQKLAEKQRQMEAKGVQAASTPAEDLNGLPPLTSSSRRSVGTTDNESSSELMTRALGGFNAAFPFVGVVAGYSTIELMQQQSEWPFGWIKSMSSEQATH